MPIKRISVGIPNLPENLSAIIHKNKISDTQVKVIAI